MPTATFASYYGRPVLKRPTWQARDIAGYLFLGGLSAGSALLGAGGDLTGRPQLRRVGRLAALAGVSGSTAALIDDLGRPARFLNMLRVAKPTSPMSMGTWLLAGFGPAVGVAAASEGAGLLPGGAGRLVRVAGRVGGLLGASVAPAVATYTAVLLADTAVPTWHEARDELPFVFAGSSAASAGGVAMALVPGGDAGPARRLAVLGSAMELAAEMVRDARMGLAGEPLRRGPAGRLHRLGQCLTAGGAIATGLWAGRSRVGAGMSGTALVAGAACTRFAVFTAGVAATEDPRYTVVPQ
ncbi:MAG TPA: NrfD/PsrC family molybdoenzyme membrane anchor subunit, partial [Acidimicrobiales bacterium]|nr:NrfD/PsrC family molybdoenzyme membrane anchor subunit [Acidimicrobiales bacterium]